MNDPLAALDAETRRNIADALWVDELRAEALPAGVMERLTSHKNSNRAFGERMRTRLTYLLEHPDSFTPSLKRRYGTLMEHAESLTPHQAYAMSALLGPDSSKGYEQLPPSITLEFPRHHAEQLQTQVGWYFFVGSCTGSDGKEYGVEVMFWRYALLPVPLARELGLSDVENQIVEMQLAIAVAGERHYQSVPYVVAGTTGLLEYGASGIAATMGKNSIAPTGDGVFPLRVQARGTYRGEGGPVPLEVDLTLTGGEHILYQGVNGCSPCCGGVGTLYYSIPNLALDAGASRLRVGDADVTLTGGKFWFDHQWATGMIPPGSARSHVLRAASTLQPAGAAGWDWCMVEFDSGDAATYSSLHSPAFQQFYAQTGDTPPGTMTVPISGKYMDPAGNEVESSGTLSITEWIKAVDTPDPAQYLPTNTWYPNRWEYTLGPEVPEKNRHFWMTPLVPNGQSGYFAFSGHYSEGLVYLTNAAGESIGRGFAESVSYADTMLNMLALAGLPATAEMRAIFEREPRSALLKLQSIAYMLLPASRKELKRLMESCMANGLGSDQTAKAQPHGQRH